MNVRPVLLSLLMCGVFGACTDSQPEPEQTLMVIAPQDFVLMPCGPARADRPCALVIAGGKRVLFGAPAGVSATLSPEDLRQLDAVIVFSLRAPDIEGLDEVRNASWQAGRDAPLLTIGPRGVLDTVAALNKAYEQADALRIVEQGIPPGGYDAAILLGRDAVGVATVFDTGDVRIEPAGKGYRVHYNREAVLDLQPCGAGDAGALDLIDESYVRVGCEGAASDLVWPVQQPRFIARRSIP